MQVFVAASILPLIAGCGGNAGSTAGGGGGSPTAVTFSFSVGAPSAVAAKIGSGSYTAQSLNSGKLSLSIPSGTTSFAVAYVCTVRSSVVFQEVFEASTADGSSFTLPCAASSSSKQTGTLSANLDATGIPQATAVSVAAENGDFLVMAGAPFSASFSFSAPAGSDRIEVLAYNSVSQGLPSSSSLVAARNFDNQAVPGTLNGGNQIILGPADETSQQSITYTNIPAGYSAPYTAVNYLMGGVGFPVSTSTTEYPALPAGATESDDFYAFFGTAISLANPGEMMIVAKSATSAGPVSFSFPSPWTYAGPTPAAGPTFNLAYSGFSGNEGVYRSVFTSWGTTSPTEMEVTASANYQNGSATLTLPDLSGLTGFVSAPPSGAQILWVALIAQNNLGIQKPIAANSIIATVENSGTYTVP